MPKVSEAHRSARRAEIVDAAARAFARTGYRGTSMASIIEESGLSAGAIYGHFAGKQELFVAVASRVLAARTSELDQRAAGRPPLSPGELIATLLDGVRREPFSHVIVLLWAEALVDPEIHRLVNGVFARLRSTITERLEEWAAYAPGRVDGDPHEWAARAAPVVLGLAPGFLVQRTVADDFDEDAYLREVVGLLPR
ncbi:TetR/AcrR family transcriptional regulator [Agromyces agglutinans]|uniref:TetR/AcrR family transcriptional regulator n=1 Tax=Agromyces agglutinans TaxID=2662258 RepID=UPI00156291EA|nr:TetR/AcrR family transcriptional regulator [Agromyces agglutinans]